MKNFSMKNLLNNNEVLSKADNFLDKSLLDYITQTTVKKDYDFKNLSKNIKFIFKEYNPQAVITALNCMELWLPNISSGFKFAILYNIFLGMKIEEFNSSRYLQSYEDFENFATQVIKVMPTFPMMEDYIPETDWGEIKLDIENERYSIFYGGLVERITDFVEAFIILHKNNARAIKELSEIARIQHSIINETKNTIDEEVDSLNLGNFEVPSEKFWHKLSPIIQSLIQNDTSLNSYTINLGAGIIYTSIEEVGDALLEARLNQSLLVKINHKYFPFFIRNHFSILIEKWSTSQVSEIEASKNFCIFMNKRFRCMNDIPVVLYDDSKRYSTVIGSVFNVGNKIYFLVFCKDLKATTKFENEINQALNKRDFGINKINSHMFMSLVASFGKRFLRKDLKVIYILNDISTVNTMVELPKSGLIISLPDLVTIFDSIESLDELDDFLIFYKDVKEKQLMPTGWADTFATYKNQHGLLEEGAVTFDVITFDPHGGSNWRFDYLSKYWLNAIVNFPDGDSKWIVHHSYDGIQHTYATNKHITAWSTEISDTTIHFLINIDELLELKPANARIVNFFCETSTDAFSQRKNLLNHLPIFKEFERIIFDCHHNPKNEISEDVDIDFETKNLVESLSWRIKSKTTNTLVLFLEIDLIGIMQGCSVSKDSEFQANLTELLMTILYKANGKDIDICTLDKIRETKNFKQRVALGTTPRKFDSKDSLHFLPEAIHYKTARKELAKVIKELGYDTGQYELETAKELINCIASSYLDKIQSFIMRFDRNDLIEKTLINYDSYIQQNYTQKYRYIESLKHVVNFDREEESYKSQKEFIKQGNNHRYLIERLVANTATGSEVISKNDFLLLLGYVDWLHTLYSASDVLHNGLEIGGIEVDSQYVPRVFYSNEGEAFELELGKEFASYQLGTTINEEDEVKAPITSEVMEKLDEAFVKDTKFSLTRLIQVLDILTAWASVNRIPMENCYKANVAEMVRVCASQIVEIDSNNVESIKSEVKTIIDFLTLDKNRILKRLGYKENNFDIPIFEHSKRDQKLNLKPMISLEEDVRIWSAGAVYRTQGIWLSRIREGWLPVDFDWDSVNEVVGGLKKQIEKDLEIVSHSILIRLFNPKYCQQGFDFKKRFKLENFEDVGDFDSLAYIPETNTWIMIECKYNQTPFCLKDMKRLQEKIFGNHKKSHIPKIMRRYEFLLKNHEKIRNLLNYPAPLDDEIKILNLYVAREINWIHKKTPYETNVNFLQINNLEFWLKENVIQ